MSKLILCWISEAVAVLVLPALIANYFQMPMTQWVAILIASVIVHIVTVITTATQIHMKFSIRRKG